MHIPRRSDAIIVARGVSRSIDDQVLLRPTDLSAGPGECVAVLGPNGAGKTTLLRILAGHLLPTTGEVHCDLASHEPGGDKPAPIDERNPAIRAAIATLLGAPGFYPDLTLIEQLRLIGASWGFAPDQAEKRAATVLDQFGITELQRRFAHELSSGQTQLFTLAATFARPARVLILDEPEQRLDPDRKTLLVAAIRTARDVGACVILSCHDHEVVDQVATERIRLGS